MDLGIAHGLAIGNGILTVENERQALIRAAVDDGDKGGDARARLPCAAPRPQPLRRPPDDRAPARTTRAARRGSTRCRRSTRWSWRARTPRPWRREFVDHRLGREPEIGGGAADEDFFRAIVPACRTTRSRSTRAIAKVLAANWRLERVDSILRAILRAAAFELIARKDVPAKAVIDEYVELTHAFFNGEEPKFVNAALDKLAHRKRAPEFGEAPPEDELEF